MAWRFVKQPNGKLARFSDVVDDFTHMDMSHKEAVLVACREGLDPEKAEEKVRAAEEDHKPWAVGIKGDGTERWKESLELIQFRHGKAKRDKRVKEAS